VPPWPAACAAAVTTIGAAATAATKTALWRRILVRMSVVLPCRICR
jgi:hypothetical protein